jgi:hypothetical protein
MRAKGGPERAHIDLRLGLDLGDFVTSIALKSHLHEHNEGMHSGAYRSLLCRFAGLILAGIVSVLLGRSGGTGADVARAYILGASPS